MNTGGIDNSEGYSIGHSVLVAIISLFIGIIVAKWSSKFEKRKY